MAKMKGSDIKMSSGHFVKEGPTLKSAIDCPICKYGTLVDHEKHDDIMFCIDCQKEFTKQFLLSKRILHCWYPKPKENMKKPKMSEHVLGLFTGAYETIISYSEGAVVLMDADAHLNMSQMIHGLIYVMEHYDTCEYSTCSIEKLKELHKKIDEILERDYPDIP